MHSLLESHHLYISGTGLPDSVFDWTRELDSELSNHNTNNQAFSRKHWRLLQCQNGKYFLTFFISSLAQNENF